MSDPLQFEKVDPAELAKTYRRRFGADIRYRNGVWRVLVRDFFSSYIRPSDSVLDLGCGYGQFINYVQCAERYAIDLNPVTRSVLDDEVQFYEQDCSEKWPLPSNSLDVVFSSNFFEHLPTKGLLSRTLQEAYRCLRPRGLLIAIGPNAKFTSYWDFFDHHIALTELSLQEALELTGFLTRRVVGRFLPFTMVNARQYPLLFVSLYVKMPWAWRIFGRQFLVIVEKPDQSSMTLIERVSEATKHIAA
jgi:SAM-dependent methyltransferase